MDWSAPVDIYCERIDASFWAEPLNAASNMAFILAAVWAGFEARKRGIDQPAIWMLIVLAFCIGIGSFLFHTFATTWLALADTVPIWSFVAAYTLVSAALIGGAPPKRIAVAVVIAIAAGTVLWLANDSSPDATAATSSPSRFNGSEQYLPAVVAMLFFTILTQLRRHPIRWWFLAATVTFLFSLTLRTFDLALCDVWPYGTHVFWHVLNGTMIALLLQALLRHNRKAPTP
jgi:drug/metabolite transporter (DMT)-like permease